MSTLNRDRLTLYRNKILKKADCTCTNELDPNKTLLEKYCIQVQYVLDANMYTLTYLRYMWYTHKNQLIVYKTL